jgi:trans-2-enoyl-CoA reductase
MYPLNIQIHIFLIGGVRIGKTFTFKLFIQGLLGIYNKDLSSNLTKIKNYLWNLQVKLHLI